MSSQGSRRKGRSRPVVDATSFLCAAYCCCLQLLRLALRSLLGGFIGWSRTSAPQSVAAKFSRLTVWINQQVLEVTRWYDVDRCVIKPQTKAEAEAAAKAAARQHQKWQHLRSTKTTATKAASYLHVHKTHYYQTWGTSTRYRIYYRALYILQMLPDSNFKRFAPKP